MDKIASFPISKRDAHPYHAKDGKVKCLETIKFSIMTHHGCWGSVIFVQLHSPSRKNNKNKK